MVQLANANLCYFFLLKFIIFFKKDAIFLAIGRVSINIHIWKKMLWYKLQVHNSSISSKYRNVYLNLTYRFTKYLVFCMCLFFYSAAFVLARIFVFLRARLFLADTSDKWALNAHFNKIKIFFLCVKFLLNYKLSLRYLISIVSQ